MAESQTEPVGTQYKFIDNFMGGIRKDLRTDALPDSAGLTVSNVTLREGLIEVDKGYSQFMGGIEGSPQLIFQINYPNGTSDMILVTTETVFERLAGQWVYSIGSDGTNIHRTTLTEAVVTDGTTIKVASATGMSVDSKIGIRYVSANFRDITATTKGTNSVYRVAGEQVFNAGDSVSITGYAVATWNVEQTVVSTSIATDATYTDITTNLNSSGFANTTATNPRIERFGATQQHRTTITGNPVATVDTIVHGGDHTNGTYNTVALSGGAGTGVQATVVVGSNNVTGITITTDGSNYKVGDVLTIDNATIGGAADATCKVATVTTTEMTLAAGMPGRALKDAPVVIPFTCAGDLSFIPDHVVVSNWVLPITGSVNATIAGAAVVTNYMQEPFIVCKGAGGTTVRSMKLANITESPFTSAADALTSFRAKTVELFHNKIVFGRCYEDGTNYNSRIRMSASFDGYTHSLYENFESEDGGEVFDLTEGDSNIQSVRALGKLLIVYKRNAIFRGDWIGGVDASTRFQSTIFNEGAMSTHSVVKVPGKHYVVGTKNIYEYNGGLTVNNIGDPIREDLYTPNRFANVTMKEFIHCVYDPEMQEFQLFYPEGTVKGMRKAFRYSEQNQAWSARTYTHYFNYGVNFTSTETLTWGQLTQPWSNYNQPWVSAFFVTEKLHRFLLGQGNYVGPTGEVQTETAYVYDANAVATKDTTYAIPWQYDTKDFYLPNSFIRVDFLDLYASGDDVTLWYSEDLGVIWTRVRSLEPRTEIGRERVHLNKASKRLRFRLKGSSANFQLGWAGFSYTPEFSW